jgi:hypothetical protein
MTELRPAGPGDYERVPELTFEFGLADAGTEH